MINFLCHTSSKSTFYVLAKLITTWVTQFCVVSHPSLFVSDLVYTIRFNPILWLNLNYKNLQKYVDTTNFLRMNLYYC